MTSVGVSITISLALHYIKVQPNTSHKILSESINLAHMFSAVEWDHDTQRQHYTRYVYLTEYHQGNQSHWTMMSPWAQYKYSTCYVDVSCGNVVKPIITDTPLSSDAFRFIGKSATIMIVNPCRSGFILGNLSCIIMSYLIMAIFLLVEDIDPFPVVNTIAANDLATTKAT